MAAEFEKDLDDYNSIMVKALADRFAEALLNICMKNRKEIWLCLEDNHSSHELKRLQRLVQNGLSSLSRSFRNHRK
jgi:cobalamin-dependent methionine synthase I